MKLTSALVERLDKLPSGGVSEPVAMEFATALLLAESAFENYSNLAADFPRQVEQMIARLDAARAGRVAADGGAPVLDEMSRRAQERVLIAQVGREIQANLRHMEQVLDAFFRDNSKRAELESLRKDSEQVRGALTILGLDEAERLLGMCQAQIETYLDPEVSVSNDELELLAESLSGLGFYIEAVEQQRPERDRLIAPLIARRLGEAPNEAPGERDSVEQAVEELRAALPRLLDEVQSAPADRAAREGLRSKLAALRDDAELIGDVELVQQAGAALAAFDAGGAAHNLAAVVEAIADTRRAAARALRGDAAAARGRRERPRRGAARDLPRRGGRGARDDSRTVMRCSTPTGAIARRWRRCGAASTRSRGRDAWSASPTWASTRTTSRRSTTGCSRSSGR